MCEDLPDDEFQRLVEEDDEIPWSCLLCQIKHTAEIFPFGLLSKLELVDLYGVDLPSHLHTLTSFESLSKLVNLPNLNDFDIDDNIINIVNSKYHSLGEINKIKLPRQNFSIFHTNMRSLSKHFDLLHTQLSTINIPFDVTGISESKQQLDKSFFVNVDIKGYSMYTQPTKSSCGGCAIGLSCQE